MSHWNGLQPQALSWGKSAGDCLALAPILLLLLQDRLSACSRHRMQEVWGSVGLQEGLLAAMLHQLQSLLDLLSCN